MPIFTEIKAKATEDEIQQVDTHNMPILALRNMVLFPGITMPVAIGRAQSMALVNWAHDTNALIGVVCQREASTESPDQADLYEVGVVAEILKVLELPDNTTNVILRGLDLFHLDAIIAKQPFLRGDVTLIEERGPADNDREFEALVLSIKDITLEMLKKMGEGGREMTFAIKHIEDAAYLVNFLCCNTPIEPDMKQKMLEDTDVKSRGYMLYSTLFKQAQLIDLKESIQSKTREDLTQQQREHFLQQQIRTIQDELGNTDDDDVEALSERASLKKWDSDTEAQFNKELKKLMRLNPQVPDYSVQYAYLDQLLNLPWNEYTHDSFNLKKV
ncbi:MAG: LON peptidase substrate-binding domain-containing protein, partial [Muribaculaceae bacterium]